MAHFSVSRSDTEQYHIPQNKLKKQKQLCDAEINEVKFRKEGTDDIGLPRGENYFDSYNFKLCNPESRHHLTRNIILSRQYKQNAASW